MTWTMMRISSSIKKIVSCSCAEVVKSKLTKLLADRADVLHRDEDSGLNRAMMRKGGASHYVPTTFEGGMQGGYRWFGCYRDRGGGNRMMQSGPMKDGGINRRRASRNPLRRGHRFIVPCTRVHNF